METTELMESELNDDFSRFIAEGLIIATTNYDFDFENAKTFQDLLTRHPILKDIKVPEDPKANFELNTNHNKFLAFSILESMLELDLINEVVEHTLEYYRLLSQKSKDLETTNSTRFLEIKELLESEDIKKHICSQTFIRVREGEDIIQLFNRTFGKN